MNITSALGYENFLLSMFQTIEKNKDSDYLTRRSSDLGGMAEADKFNSAFHDENTFFEIKCALGYMTCSLEKMLDQELTFFFETKTKLRISTNMDELLVVINDILLKLFKPNTFDLKDKYL